MVSNKKISFSSVLIGSLQDDTNRVRGIVTFDK